MEIELLPFDHVSSRRLIWVRQASTLAEEEKMYFEAAKIVEDARKKKASLKNLVFSSSNKNTKALYALSCETLRYKTPLLEIAETCGLLKDKRLRNNETLSAVLLYEHLLGKGLSGKYKVIIQKYRSSIHSSCERLKVKYGVTHLKQAFQKMVPVTDTDKPLPKYVRVNTLLTTNEDVIRQLEKKFELRDHNRENNLKCNGSIDWYVKDEHIPDLLMFDAAVQFHTDPLYLSGKIIIQDKASCFPAYILHPPPGSTVIDCCAAPGNKTTHLAAIMKNTGTVYAFDRDATRLSTLQKLVSKAGATCVHAECRDFLSVKPQDKKYANVGYILVDPSCSGSGMLNRQRQYTDDVDSCSTGRLQQLAKFQISILKHALSFPRVRKVVYSTCSIHDEENEMVVEEVWAQVCEVFDIENIMPNWKYRGRSKYKHGTFCLRMSYEDCKTNGFFVACFVRKDAVTRCHTAVNKPVRPGNGQILSTEDSHDHSNQDYVLLKSNKHTLRNRAVNRKIRTMNTNMQILKATTSWKVASKNN